MRAARRILALASLVATVPFGFAAGVGHAAGATPGAGAEASRFDPHPLVAPPLRALRIPRPERTTLPNGIVVFLLEDHTFPVVTGTAYVPSSPGLVPDDRVGLAELTGDAMRRGGSAAHPGDALDDRLAAIGASISTWLSGELGYGGFRSLAEHADEVVGLFAEVLARPVFPEDKLQLAKLSLHQEIASRNDEVFPIASRLANRAVYGKGSAWARIPEHASAEAVTRADCQRLHAQVFVPERMVLAVYGDFRGADMKRRLAVAFGGWKKSGTPAPSLPGVGDPVPPRLYFAPKEDVTQSVLLLAGLGARVDEPDVAALDVVVQAWGGGGQSRLNRHIRTERGLAYTTGAEAGEEYRRPGVFLAWSLTRNDSALTALELVRGEVAGMLEKPLGDDEFRAAKESVENQFVFNFEQRSAPLFRAAYYQVQGYPADFLSTYQRALDAVTPASAFAAARRHIKTGGLAVIVVGKEQAFEHPLEREGLPVERVDITIPPEPDH
jgi:zinc protease